MSYLYQATIPLTEDKLKALKAKLGCEVKYEKSDGLHNYTINKNLNLEEIRMVEDYGLEFVIGMSEESKSTPSTPPTSNPSSNT